MQAPLKFELDDEAFENVLDLEAAVRLAATAQDGSEAPWMEIIHDAWLELRPSLPEATREVIAASIEDMLAAFNQGEFEAIQNEQRGIALVLEEFRNTLG